MKTANTISFGSEVRRGRDGSWATSLVPDQSDPFFYDHPLDHVPGILLVSALLELVRQVVSEVGPTGPRTTLALRFPAFCENDLPISLMAERSCGRWEVGAWQRGRPVCEGWIGMLGREAVILDSAATPRVDPTPIRADYVHRVNAENVLIGSTSAESVVAVLSPRSGHFLDLCDSGCHSPEKLIEAARQATTMVPLRFGGHPVDSNLVWLSVAADLPNGVAADVPMSVRFSRDCGHTSRYRFCFDLLAAGAVVGRVVSECAVLSQENYELLRNAMRFGA